MSEAATSLRAKQFTVGGVLSSSLGIFLRNALPFGVIAVILSVPYMFVDLTHPIDNNALSVSQHPSEKVLFNFTRSLYSLFMASATMQVIAAVLASAVFNDLRGQPTTAVRSLQRALSQPLSVLFGAILFTFLYWLCFAALLVPAILFMVAFWVFMPAMVLEGKNIRAAARRSRELTKGRRLSIFWLFLLLGLAVVFGVWAVRAVLGSAGSGPMFRYIVIGLQILYNEFSAVMVTVGYYFLRAERDGVAPGEVAEVFG